MKVKCYGCMVLCLACFCVQAQEATHWEKPVELEISAQVLQTAAWASFKYQDVLEAAKSGNPTAIRRFAEFSSVVDGVEALDHAVTFLDLVAVSSDSIIGLACYDLNPKLKKVMLDRFWLAQGRTKNEQLRTPLSQWAPSTWSVFNGGLPK